MVGIQSKKQPCDMLKIVHCRMREPTEQVTHLAYGHPKKIAVSITCGHQMSQTSSPAWHQRCKILRYYYSCIWQRWRRADVLKVIWLEELQSLAQSGPWGQLKLLLCLPDAVQMEHVWPCPEHPNLQTGAPFSGM